MYSNSTPEDRAIARRILADAKELVQKGWCQGANARNKDGRPVAWTDETAVSFCAAGACAKASRDILPEGANVHSWYPGEVAADVMQIRAQSYGAMNHVKYNDEAGRTQAEVVALLEKSYEDIDY